MTVDNPSVPQQDYARKLAVRYDAWNTAVRDDNKNSILCWGKMLIEAQAVTGIELHKPSLIALIIRQAEKAQAEAQVGR